MRPVRASSYDVSGRTWQAGLGIAVRGPLEPQGVGGDVPVPGVEPGCALEHDQGRAGLVGVRRGGGQQGRADALSLALGQHRQRAEHRDRDEPFGRVDPPAGEARRGRRRAPSATATSETRAEGLRLGVHGGDEGGDVLALGRVLGAERLSHDVDDRRPAPPAPRRGSPASLIRRCYARAGHERGAAADDQHGGADPLGRQPGPARSGPPRRRRAGPARARAPAGRRGR